jgi:hypothetical protein
MLIFQSYGFIMYAHAIEDDFPVAELSVPGIRDRGYVLLDGVGWYFVLSLKVSFLSLL